jgi:uncharacterized protein (DUF4415 family)
MSKKNDHIEVDGIRFSKDVDIDAIKKLGSGMSPELEAALKEPAKIRITTMVDEDIYRELKRIAGQPGAKKYQTLLNDLLRKALFGSGEPTSKVLDELASHVADLRNRSDVMRKELDSLKRQLKSGRQAAAGRKRA